MSKTVRIIGLEQVVDDLQDAQRAVHGVGRKWLRDWAISGVKQVQLHTLNAGAVDTNELIQGIHYKLRGLEATIRPSDRADEYAIFVEEGTRPHWPPMDAIRPWAERHGIPAFLVARKIALEGTEPRHMWRDSFKDLEREVDRDLPRFAKELVGRI